MNCITLYSWLQTCFTVCLHAPCKAAWLTSCVQDYSVFPILTFVCLLTVSCGKKRRHFKSVWLWWTYHLNFLSGYTNCSPQIPFKGKGKWKISLKSTARAEHLLQGGRVDHHLRVFSGSLHTVKKRSFNQIQTVVFFNEKKQQPCCCCCTVRTECLGTPL